MIKKQTKMIKLSYIYIVKNIFYFTFNMISNWFMLLYKPLIGRDKCNVYS